MKNNSARKKLIPAAAMLAVSAAMLATSTYAWFTMSKEVEVTGIQLTASTPAGIQISLGNGQGASTPKLTMTNGVVDAPGDTDTDVDWANTVAFSSYYKVGKLAPASSTTGEHIYYTNDATGVGKNIKEDAIFAQADTTKMAELVLADADLAGTDAGYYVDFPVWFRCSQTEGTDVNLAVTATFAVGKIKTDGVLYKSARVAILEANDLTNAVTNDPIIMDSTASYYNADGNDTATHKVSGVTGNAAVSSVSNGTASWAVVTTLTQASTFLNGVATNGDAVVTIPNTAVSGQTIYGASVKKIVRVWLEGEDVNCFNDNAGQDFIISLKFTKLVTT